MKRLSVVLAATLCAVSFAAVTIAAEDKPAAEAKKPAAEAKKPAADAGKKPTVTREKTTYITATVEAIDLEKRIVTVKGPKGNIFDITAGEQVKNLPQVKVGDSVNVKYYESIAVKVFKPGEITQGSTVAVGAERLAKPGEKPSGIVGAQVTVTATVESISPKKTTVTLKMSDGKYKVVKVEDKRNLENVKVGDELMITLTETLAISVTPAKKK
jgi:hypothetical protein